MARSRNRSNRKAYKEEGAKHIGWSKAKTTVIIVMLVALAAFMIFIFIMVFLLR